MATILTAFYVGTTKKFTVTCKIGGEAKDITGDTVTFTVKTNKDDADSAAKIQEDADVASQGADGIAIFELTPTITEIAPGDYHCDVQWVRSGGAEYVLLSQAIKALERVSDV
jgi:hypothetical protein